MTDDMRFMRPVLCIVGPTAAGKSDLAQAVARALDGEVVSADSMQVYRGMDIGTGKVREHERTVPHHGIDLVDPGQPYSAALFQEYARATFAAIEGRGRISVLCGGTGLYVRAAVDDYRFPKGEQQDNPVREHYTEIAQREGFQTLWDLLAQEDLPSAKIIPPRDVKRVVRAFELLEEGTSYAEQRAKLAAISAWCPTVFFGLRVDPVELNARIDARVDAMVEAGLVAEVEGLLAQGFEKALTAQQAIGYKEIVSALQGRITLDRALCDIKTATHRYAKRQRTWFRKDARIQWLDVGKISFEERVDAVVRTFRDAASVVGSVKEKGL